MTDEVKDVLHVKEAFIQTFYSPVLGTEVFQLNASGDLVFAEFKDLAFGTTNGSKIGTATSQKIGFWGATPVIQQDVTAAGVTAADLLTALNTLGILNSI